MSRWLTTAHQPGTVEDRTCAPGELQLQWIEGHSGLEYQSGLDQRKKHSASSRQSLSQLSGFSISATSTRFPGTNCAMQHR